MPRFLVEFSGPVIYLKGHSRERQVTSLPVNAPDADQAEQHAIRRTSGLAKVIKVTEVEHA